MPRRNRPTNRRVKVTREVIALAQIAAHRAAQSDSDQMLLPGRVLGSRRISGRMLKALQARVA